MNTAPPSLPLLRESVFVGGISTVIALLSLRVRPDWTRGVIGGGDAWSNLWNLHHIDRALQCGCTPFFTDQLWAPEGTRLVSHTLSISSTVPGSLLGRVVGFPLAYNILVLGSFVLAAVTMYRLVRRLGVAPGPALVGALVFAFAPHRSARALGHLNLLGSGWIPLGLEGLLILSRGHGRRKFGGAALAIVAFAGLTLCDWYLTILGGLAAGSFAAFELWRTATRSRRVLLGAFLLVAVLSVAPAVPLAIELAQDSDGSRGGHDAKWCSVALTSLVIPGRIQLISAFTRPLTERNHQSPVEAAAYLGLLPLACVVVCITPWRKRPRELDFALASGAVALVLSLGPYARVFDRLLEVPLPYALLERLVPPLRIGGCVNRFHLLVFLPLALATAFALDRLAARVRRPSALYVIVALLIAVEYAPMDPGVSTWPLTPPDPALRALSDSGIPGGVLDIDPGQDALIRQLQHQRPITFGWIARRPRMLFKARAADPVLGPLLDPSQSHTMLPSEVALHLKRRWKVAFVVAPDWEPHRSRAARLGLPLFARDGGRTVIYRVP
jgi:hypothetical protein